jgi:tetratricopeptide (TPR) repeat protein
MCILGCIAGTIPNDHISIIFGAFLASLKVIETNIASHAEEIAEYSKNAYANGVDNSERLALLYHRLGVGDNALARYAKALEWYFKALATREKVLGKDHRDTAETYNNIAGVYYSQGDYAKALEWYEKALLIKEKALGNEHPDTAGTYNNIALVYNSQGDYANALEWHGKALLIKEKVLGKEHPSTAGTYNNIALVYKSQGDYDTALKWHVKNYRALVSIDGPYQHKETWRRCMKSTYAAAGYSKPFDEWLKEVLHADEQG